MSSASFSPLQVTAAGSAQWRTAIRQALADTRCACPAFLTVDMDAAHQTVTVQVAVQERVHASAVNPGATAAAAGPTSYRRPPVAKPQWVTLAPISNVPIVLPRGGGFSFTLPLKKGAEGLLVFCDCCFDLWWQRSGVQNQVGNHRHELWDCGFIPGMGSQPNVLDNYSTDSAQLRTDDGSAYVEVGANQVTVLAPTTTITAATKVDVKSPAVTVVDGLGGTAQKLMTDTFYQWYITNVQPFLVSKGYAGPVPPVTGCETTVLKGQ